ncbi:hypothetical protein [Proteus mirabilis]|uniref:hypothetical protein n=1 Tax=Proteus mirabilis TaxID=584 RepID=UPI0034D4B869
METFDFLNMTKDDVTKDFLISNFAYLGDKDPKINPNQEIVIDDSKIKSNSPIRLFKNYDSIKNQTTKIGRIIHNIFLYTIDIRNENDEIVGNTASLIDFINEPITGKTLGKPESVLSEYFIDGKVTPEVMEEYINRLQWYSYTLAIFQVPSIDMKTINPSKTIRKNVTEKLEGIKEAIEQTDVLTFSKTEKEILEFAKGELEKDGATGKLIYDSGFNGSWNNNYKVTSLFRGASTKSDEPSNFNISTSSLVDGVKKKDIPAFADLAVLGAAGRAVDTRKGGYLTKIFNSAFSALIADVKGSDCGTKRTITVKLDKSNINRHVYRFYIENGKLQQITLDNKDSLIGKTVQMRSPMRCESRRICNKCLGDRLYKIQIRNIGLHVARISSRIMNFSMKKFHNMEVTPKPYNILNFVKKIK